jgi:hypothetical protein
MGQQVGQVALALRRSGDLVDPVLERRELTRRAAGIRLVTDRALRGVERGTVRGGVRRGEGGQAGEGGERRQQQALAGRERHRLGLSSDRHRHLARNSRAS